MELADRIRRRDDAPWRSRTPAQADCSEVSDPADLSGATALAVLMILRSPHPFPLTQLKGLPCTCAPLRLPHQANQGPNSQLQTFSICRCRARNMVLVGTFCAPDLELALLLLSPSNSSLSNNRHWTNKLFILAAMLIALTLTQGIVRHK